MLNLPNIPSHGPNPQDEFVYNHTDNQGNTEALPQNRSLIIACGALAKEIVFLIKINHLHHVDLTCLPASLHNRPQNIIPRLKEKIDAARQANYTNIFIGYADCGTGGLLDKLIEQEKLTRISGTHCYGFFSGLEHFEQMMEEEPGTFFLTDYLARHFDTLIIKGMGLDRFPELEEQYFGNYSRLIYLAQTNDVSLDKLAQQAADRLKLSYQKIQTGYGLLETFIQQANNSSKP